jgi:hypothetical protein
MRYFPRLLRADALSNSTTGRGNARENQNRRPLVSMMPPIGGMRITTSLFASVQASTPLILSVGPAHGPTSDWQSPGIPTSKHKVNHRCWRLGDDDCGIRSGAYGGGEARDKQDDAETVASRCALAVGKSPILCVAGKSRDGSDRRPCTLAASPTAGR